MLLSIIILTAYLFVCYLTFGITPSISHTYYCWANKFGNKYKWAFSVFAVALATSVMPIWLERSGENIQFMCFLACFGLITLGVSPTFFKEDRRLHITGTVMCGSFAGIWCILSGFWPVMLGVIILALCVLKWYREKVLYVIEVLLFYSTIICIQLS